MFCKSSQGTSCKFPHCKFHDIQALLTVVFGCQDLPTEVGSVRSIKTHFDKRIEARQSGV